MTESARSPNASTILSKLSKPATQREVSIRRLGQAFALVFASTVVAATVQHADGQGSALSSNTESSFDGTYCNREFNYGFGLDTRSRTATATISNSPLYRVGQIMLRYLLTTPHGRTARFCRRTSIYRWQIPPDIWEVAR
jgi:hypothetical protein